MSRPSERSVRRVPVLAGLVVALLAGALADRAGAVPVSRPATSAARQPMPVAAPAQALSSSWFCAGVSDGAKDPVPGRVVVGNYGAVAVSARVRNLTDRGHDRTVPVTVGAHGQKTVDETGSSGGGAWAGAIVDMDGGSVAVDQVTGGPLGASSSPCASSGSAHWYFPSGQTRINAAEVISLLNPYPADSIVDLSFTTDQGVEQPQSFQGIDVPGGGLVTVDLGSHLRRRASIATTVSARTGSVVAWETSLIGPPPAGQPLVGTAAARAPLADPALPVPGATVVLGAAAASTSWAWPDGLAGNGADERYVVYNPGDAPAAVRLSIGLDQGQAEPFELTVGPRQVVSVVSEQQARIPAGLAHSAQLVSTNGVPVVAERTSTDSDASGAGVPLTGVAQLIGAQMDAQEWLVAAPAADSGHQGRLTVLDPGPERAQVTVDVMANGAYRQIPGGDLRAGPGGRAVLRIGSGITEPLLVRSDHPVYVEYDLFGTAAAHGIGFALGVPLLGAGTG